MKITFSHNFSKGVIFWVSTMIINNNNNSGAIAPAIGANDFDFMSEQFIHAQIINIEIPSIVSTPDRALSTRDETSINELYLWADNLPNIIDSAEKDGAVNHISTASLRGTNENNDMLHAALRKKFNTWRNFVQDSSRQNVGYSLKC